MKPCDRNIESTLRLVDEMIKLADQGDMDREDRDCGILYGILRDSAYKLKRLAEIEKAKHMAKGGWDRRASPPNRPHQPIKSKEMTRNG